MLDRRLEAGSQKWESKPGTSRTSFEWAARRLPAALQERAHAVRIAAGPSRLKLANPWSPWSDCLKFEVWTSYERVGCLTVFPHGVRFDPDVERDLQGAEERLLRDVHRAVCAPAGARW